MNGAVDGDDSTVGHPGQHAGVTDKNLLDVRVADDAEADEIAGRAELGGRPGDLRGGVGVRFQRGGPTRPQRRVEAGVDDRPRHRAALAAQSDKPDTHQLASESTSS